MQPRGSDRLSWTHALPACRVAERTVKVGPYTVPPGTIVATPLFAIHNTKHNWDAPEEYRCRAPRVACPHMGCGLCVSFGL
jgi:cytochrome P450